MDLKGRNFLTLKDFTPEEITYLLDLSAELKEKKKKLMVQEQKYLLKSVVNLLLQFVRAEVLTQM